MQAITRLVFGLSVLCALGAGEAWARPRTLVVGDGVRLRIDVPPGYSFQSKNDDRQVFVKLENPVWPVVVVAAIAPASVVPADTEEAQRNLLVTQAAEILAESKEQDYRFIPLNPTRGAGVYCVFSDPSATRPEDLPPDQFLHVVAGIKSIRGAVMYFRIMCNDVSSPEYQEALGLFVNYFDGA